MKNLYIIISKILIQNFHFEKLRMNNFLSSRQALCSSLSRLSALLQSAAPYGNVPLLHNQSPLEFFSRQTPAFPHFLLNVLRYGPLMTSMNLAQFLFPGQGESASKGTGSHGSGEFSSGFCSRYRLLKDRHREQQRTFYRLFRKLLHHKKSLALHRLLNMCSARNHGCLKENLSLFLFQQAHSALQEACSILSEQPCGTLSSNRTGRRQ